MQRPNILFFFPDQWRGDWTGANPAVPVRTPNLDALNRRGVRFSKAICPSPLCAPCRAGVATGLEYDNGPVQGNDTDLPLDHDTLYRRLQQAGYWVTGCGKFDLNKKSCTSRQSAWGVDGRRFLPQWGFDDGINNEGKIDGYSSGLERPQGPYLHYLEEQGLRQAHLDDLAARRGEPLAAFPTPLPDEVYCDNWIGENGLTLLQRAPAGRPWFLQVNFTGPHNPWDITRSMTGWYQDVEFPLSRDMASGSPQQHQEVRRNYAAMCENIDRWLGRYLYFLQQRGELDNTLICFSSDHGEMLGDRQRWGKNAPYQPSVGVPLTVAGPDIIAGVHCDLPTTILDLGATFLEVSGAVPAANWDSRSLWALLTGQTQSHRAVVRSGLGPWRLVWDGRHKLIRRQGEEELYDLDADPAERDNLALSAAGGRVLANLQKHFVQQPTEE